MGLVKNVTGINVWTPCVDTAGASGDEKGQDVYSHPSPGEKGSSCSSVSLGRTLKARALWPPGSTELSGVWDADRWLPSDH